MPLRTSIGLLGLIPVICVVVLLGGCSATVAGNAAAVPTAAPGSATPNPDAPIDALAASRPQQLVIPSLAVDTSVIDLGLRPDGTMEVPADASTAGWYVHSPTPGELGPSVLAAHVDWQGRPGVFVELRRAAPGDPVQVRRADGSTVTFAVRRVETYPKDRFPTAEVFGDVDSAQLRLITCGGEYDPAARSFRDNIVVYAERSA